MQDQLTAWAVSVTVAIIFSAMMNALLPDTNIKKYIQVVLGIIVTVIMLSPLFSLFGGSNLQQEVKNTLERIDDVSEIEHDAARYKDYIEKVYMQNP